MAKGRRAAFTTGALAAALAGAGIHQSATAFGESTASQASTDPTASVVGALSEHPAYPGLFDEVSLPFDAVKDPELHSQLGFRYDRGLVTDPTTVESILQRADTLQTGPWLVSPSEWGILQHEEAVQYALQVHEAQVAERVGDSFAGAFVDQKQQGVVYIYATTPVDASAFQDLFPAGTKIVAFVVKNSLTTLTKTLDAIAADRESLSASGTLIVGAGVDMRNNVVAAALDPASTNVDLKAYGPVVTTQAPSSDGKSRATKYPPLQGGLQVDFPSLGQSCSSGFNVLNSGLDRELTASHCSNYNNNVDFSSNSIHISHTEDARFVGGAADVVLLPVGHANATENVYNTDTKSFTLNQAPNAFVPVGGNVAFSGAGANNGNHPSNQGNTSGTITSNDYLSGQGFHHQAVASTSEDICAGDSGGPFFNTDGSAYGIESGGTTDDGGTKCGRTNWFSQWIYIAATEPVSFGT